MGLAKKKLKMNSFFVPHLNYFPLIWMIHGSFSNSRVKNLYKRCLRLIYSGKTFSYEEVMEKDGSVSIHYKNIQTLAIKMFKIKMACILELFLIYFRSGGKITIALDS